MEKSTNDNGDQDRPEAPPSAKRPKSADDAANEPIEYFDLPIITKAVFNKQPGTIEIDREDITWEPEDLTAVGPVFIRTADLTHYQRNTTGNPSRPGYGSVHRTSHQEAGEPQQTLHTFKFPSTDNGRQDSETFFEAVRSVRRAAKDTREEVGESKTVLEAGNRVGK